MKVALKDFSQDPPEILVEYELQNCVAVAIEGGSSVFTEDLEDEGISFCTGFKDWKAVFPEDGEEFMEGLFWHHNFAQAQFVNAAATDKEGEGIAARFMKKARACLEEAQHARNQKSD